MNNHGLYESVNVDEMRWANNILNSDRVVTCTYPMFDYLDILSNVVINKWGRPEKQKEKTLKEEIIHAFCPEFEMVDDYSSPIDDFDYVCKKEQPNVK